MRPKSPPHYLLKPFSVQTDKSMSTGGTTTKTDDKCYPRKLCHWDDFIEVQQGYFNTIYNVFHPSPNTARQFFDPRLAVEYLRRKANPKLVASEEDIKPHQHLALQQPVVDIISVLSEMAQMHPILKDLNIGHGVTFENHPNTLSKESKDS